MSYTTSCPGHSPRSRPAKESLWRDLFADFEASGQSVLSFCQARQLKTSTFYAWRLRLKKDKRHRPSPPSPERRSASPAFLPVVVEPRPFVADETLQVELRGGRVLRLPASMPAARLAEVLHALEGQA